MTRHEFRLIRDLLSEDINNFYGEKISENKKAQDTETAALREETTKKRLEGNEGLVKKIRKLQKQLNEATNLLQERQLYYSSVSDSVRLIEEHNMYKPQGAYGEEFNKLCSKYSKEREAIRTAQQKAVTQFERELKEMELSYGSFETEKVLAELRDKYLKES